MFSVSILNSITGQWRTTVETSLSACVQLTLGLSTEWIVAEWNVGMTASDIVKGNGRNIYPKTTERYKHALRSLISRWMRRYQKFGQIKEAFGWAAIQIEDFKLLLRLSDIDLLNSIKMIKEHTEEHGIFVPWRSPLR